MNPAFWVLKITVSLNSDESTLFLAATLGRGYIQRLNLERPKKKAVTLKLTNRIYFMNLDSTGIWHEYLFFIRESVMETDGQPAGGNWVRNCSTQSS